MLTRQCCFSFCFVVLIGFFYFVVVFYCLFVLSRFFYLFVCLFVCFFGLPGKVIKNTLQQRRILTFDCNGECYSSCVVSSVFCSVFDIVGSNVKVSWRVIICHCRSCSGIVCGCWYRPCHGCEFLTRLIVLVYIRE